MKFQKLPLKDLTLIDCFHANDDRGSFTKVFHSQEFIDNCINFIAKEFYYSVSNKNSIRGMHFQLPPHDHAKIVFPIQGSFLDVILDLRIESNTFGIYHSVRLDSRNKKAIYVPSGFAHGFLSLENNTEIGYLVSFEYHKEHDRGIRWDSFGFSWPCSNPILSQRDQEFESYKNFLLTNPF